jgi:sulfur carrier protein ThiS
MKMQLKLYASLTKFLPEGSANHTAELDVDEGMTATQVIEKMQLPKEACFLVLLDGIYLTPEERDVRPIREGEALSIWPPIAGG